VKSLLTTLPACCTSVFTAQWSNGRVYQIGASADGLAALAGGVNEMPPQLKAQSVVWATGSVYQLAYQNGAWAEELFERWLNETGFPETIAEVQAQEVYSDWWDPIELSTKVGRCYYPSVFWGGWFDVCNDGVRAREACVRGRGRVGATKRGMSPFFVASYGTQTIEAWRFLQSNASGCGGQNTLFVDPHGHCGGMDAGESYFPLSRLALPLLQSFDLFTRLEADPLYRPGRAPRRGPEDADTVTFYVMGPGEEATVGNWWTTLPDFPAPAVVPYYCQPDGTLQRTPTTNTIANFTYTYDPADPVPNHGGHNLYGECGQWDQRVNEARADVLSFTTDVLAEHTVVTGRVTATLFVSSSANDTDFTAQITDVHPDGRSMLVTQGIQRMRWRLSMTEPAYLTPGEVYEVIVDLWMTSYIFEAGHRIRLSVSSSNYPRFSANRNNGRLVAFEDTAPAVIARNTLHTTAAYPSRLNLPTVKLDQVPNNYKIRLDRPELAELARFLDIDVAVEL